MNDTGLIRMCLILHGLHQTILSVDIHLHIFHSVLAVAIVLVCESVCVCVFDNNGTGQRFAIMEEKTILAMILRKYTIRSIHRRDQVRPTAEIILRPKCGVWLILTPRM
jgi:hypothetical protein